MFNEVVRISNRMLCKGLKKLEINQLIKRTILDTQPISVQYKLTEHGDTMQTISYRLENSAPKKGSRRNYYPLIGCHPTIADNNLVSAIRFHTDVELSDRMALGIIFY